MMNSSCYPDSFSLENPTFYRNLCFTLTLFEMTITSYTLYLLIYHAPPQMKEMKWYMLNMSCWTRAMDLMYSFFIIPYFFIPTLVVLPVGFFSIIGLPTEIQLVMLVINICGLGSAVLLIFENRFNAICPPYYRFKVKNRKVYHVCVFFISFSILISSFLKLEDQETAKQWYLTVFQCPIPEFITKAFSFKPVSITMLVVTVFIFSTFFATQIAFFGLTSFYFLYSMGTSKMSVATRKLQRKFFLTAWLQILTHICVIVVPMGYTFITFIIVYRNQFLVNLCTVVITFHGTITSISTIVINRPFRNRVKTWLIPKNFKTRRSSTRMNLITVSSSWM